MASSLPNQKRIALVAHEHKKPLLLAWAKRHREQLLQHKLYADGTTGSLLQQQSNLPTTRLLSGPLGGDQQTRALIATEKLTLLVFFWDPLTSQPHDLDVKALLRLAVVWDIPMACGTTTADFLFSSKLLGQDYLRHPSLP